MPPPILAEKKVITLALAKLLMSAAEQEIARQGWAMYVAFVDDSGTPILVENCSQAQPASWLISIEKAAAAARFRRPTKVWEDRIKGGAPNIMTLSGIVASEGGVPLLVDGAIVGAIGVSGGTGAEDGVIAQAVVAALAEML